MNKRLKELKEMKRQRDKKKREQKEIERLEEELDDSLLGKSKKFLKKQKLI